MARVLLVEPNRLLAKQYWAALEKVGHEVIICVNGHEAIFAADEQTPDVVVVELQLKGHNGVEFLYEFRSYPEWQRIPVVVQSLVPAEEVTAAATWSLLGISAYLYKPTTKLAKLVAVVDDLLSVGRTTNAPAKVV